MSLGDLHTLIASLPRPVAVEFNAGGAGAGVSAQTANIQEQWQAAPSAPPAPAHAYEQWAANAAAAAAPAIPASEFAAALSALAVPPPKAVMLASDFAAALDGFAVPPPPRPPLCPCPVAADFGVVGGADPGADEVEDGV